MTTLQERLRDNSRRTSYRPAVDDLMLAAADALDAKDAEVERLRDEVDIIRRELLKDDAWVEKLEARLAEAESLLREAKPYVKDAHDEAECRHDSDGEYYLDDGQYEIMETTGALIDRIDASLNREPAP